MKKVAATRGHNVSLTNFFRLGTGARGWGFSRCRALAVANFYGFLLKRLTLATSSPLNLPNEDFVSRLPGHSDFPGISAKLVRKLEITGIFHRCNNFLALAGKFSVIGTDVRESNLRQQSQTKLFATSEARRIP